MSSPLKILGCDEIDCTYCGILHISLQHEQKNISQNGVCILSEKEASMILWDDLYSPMSMIRIHDPSSELTPLKSNPHRILELAFYDVDPGIMSLSSRMSGYMKGPTTVCHAKEIVEFYKTVEDDVLIVHCYAGISRSSAVMMGFAAFKQDRDLWEKIKHSPWYYPNKHVLALILNELKEKPSWAIVY